MILAVMSAVAEPTRPAAIRMLHDGSQHCVCKIMRSLAATQSRMSRHMQILKHAGLVVHRRDAQWARHRLDPNLPENTRVLIAAALSEGIPA